MRGNIIKKNSLKIIFFGMFFLFFFTINIFCSSLAVRDNRNSEIEFSKSPERIISLVPSITEELYLLEVEEKIAGCTTYCTRPESARTKERVATAVEVNLEKVVALQPEVVFAASFTDLETMQKLRALGIKVIELPQPKNFVEICEQFMKIGKVVDRESQAKEIINNAQIEVDRIKTKVKKSQKPKVFIQVGANPLFTVTRDSFINEIIEFSGGINVAKNAKSGIFSREKVLKLNPDYIFIVTMGIVGKDEKRIWKRFKLLNAVKNNSIFIVDSNKVCSPTPLTFVEVLKEFVNILYPE